MRNPSTGGGKVGAVGLDEGVATVLRVIDQKDLPERETKAD